MSSSAILNSGPRLILVSPSRIAAVTEAPVWLRRLSSPSVFPMEGELGPMKMVSAAVEPKASAILLNSASGSEDDRNI